jgi:hypothetical protein
MTRLFLHIGNHKTGSTSIQNLLFENRAQLAKEGILYPDVGLHGGAHHKLAWATGVGQRPRNPELLESSVKEITRLAKKSIHTVVISSEEFEFVHNTAALGILKDHFDVKIVAYLRKQDHYLESACNQHVRMYDLRYTGSIYQFALKYNFFRRYNYRLLLKRWEEVFGRENILVRPYGTSLVDRDVCSDLFSLMGVSDEQRPNASSGPRLNISLPANAIPYLSHINQLSLSKGQHQAALEILSGMITGERNQRLLRNEDSTEFYEKFRQSNEMVFGHYLDLDSDPFMELAREANEEIWVNHEQIDVRLLLKLVEEIYQGAVANRLGKLLGK